MQRLWLGSLGLSLSLWLASALAQEAQWRPVARPAAPTPSMGVTLGRPVAVDASPAAPLVPVSYAAPTAPRPLVRGQNPEPPQPLTLGPPILAASGFGSPTTVTANAPPPPPPPPLPGGDPYNCGVVANPIPPIGGAPPGGAPLFGHEWLGCPSCATRKLFESDHCFDNFISPVSNPFLFEDPRALTEIRPIFIYQRTPESNWLFKSSNMEFFGIQARLAITERLSFVMNKMGWTWWDPKNGSGIFSDNHGFSEIWLGPKYTFIRNDSSGTLLAGGMTFQIPSGSSKVAQDTGTLSLVPYLSFAQNFGRSSYGSFNFMNTTGYNFSIDNKRTDYFYSSFHLDFDLANAHKFYPLLELNYFDYTKAGKTRDLHFEGRDLVNFGSQGVSGIGTLTVAPGFRYKFNEHIQAGVAVELPLVNPRDLVYFRTTFDLILRY
ncbi:MAG: hypothetical protein K2R98_21740 [Gemmataceae bacterium]|nr:hypothetical protein [Gemmataceae bacterium]